MLRFKHFLVVALALTFFTLYADVPVTIENLSKRWKLEEYSYLFISEDPEEIEKNDYIFLRKDLSFESVSEGKYEKGKWRLDAKSKRIYLSQDGEEGELVLIISKLENDELVLIIDHPSDPDAEGLKIHFKN